MIGAWGMGESFFSYGAFGGISPDGEMKAKIEGLLNEQFRQVKQLLDANKEAVTAIAEALILRNELTDIDVNEILARVEAEHPFVSESEIKKQPFGFRSEAVTAIAEALILRNELTDIDVNEILARVEAEHPFVSESEIKKQPFGF